MKGSIIRLSSRALACSVPSPFIRNFTTTVHKRSQVQTPETRALNPRWLSELQIRMRKCLALKLSSTEADELKGRLSYLENSWLELAAGREGFLADTNRRGVDKHAVQWGDMHGHVNNIIYNRFAESGRVNWTRKLGKLGDAKYEQEWATLMTPRGIGLILGSIKTDYKFPMAYPDEVTVLHKLTTKPDYNSDRFLLEAVIYSERQKRPAARCFEDIVVYNYDAAKKAPLKPFMVDALRATYDLQEKRKHETEQKVVELYGFVQQLEDAAHTN